MAENWTNPNGSGPTFSHSEMLDLVDAIVTACGLSNVLDIGAGDGRLTAALLGRGLDVYGLDIDVDRVVIANELMPGRFFEGDVKAMPFAAGQFEAVVSDGCLEYLDDAGVRDALADIRRVVSRHLVLSLDVSDAERSGRDRGWWERQCYKAGFRKHPRYYRLNPYESLNHDGPRILVVVERMSDAALSAYPLEALEEERGLHMDMLRDSGERSDAHVIRYQWACDFIRPNDRVLDAACGLGYGGHVLRALTRAANVLGIDGSEYAIDYANLCYGHGHDRGGYMCGFLPDALRVFPDASFDAVISFETLEHVDDPQGLLKEFQRVLTPGGRVIVSVPNDWSDESGEDPNPYHLQVYDIDRLRAEIQENFDLEAVYVQSASQAKVIGQRFVWERKNRELYPVDPHTRDPHSAEWWLMVGMKSPFVEAKYEERIFRNVMPSFHPSVSYADEYQNPWLGLAMITIGQRASLPALRENYASRVLDTAPEASADYAAALCVKAYTLLQAALPMRTEEDALLVKVDEYLSTSVPGRTALRWRVSLAYVKAALLRSQGRLEDALLAFLACAEIDVRAFGVHLFTKTTASLFEAGLLALALKRPKQARELWERGMQLGSKLLNASLDDVVLWPEHPNLFNHGDGIREYALAWDHIARCANGIHVLANGQEVDLRMIEASFSSEYEVVTRDLRRAGAQLRARDVHLGALRSELHSRTVRLEAAARDLLERTDTLVEERKLLLERTQRLEQSDALLIERTQLLDSASRRTAKLQEDLLASQELLAKSSQNLDETVFELHDGSQVQEKAEVRIKWLEGELGRMSALLVERTEALTLASGDLVDRTRRLESAQASLVEVRAAWEATQAALEERTCALNLASKELEERTARLEEAMAAISYASRGS